MWWATGYQQLTRMNRPKFLNMTSNSANAVRAIVQAEKAAVRWRDDGISPTSTTGMRIEAGESVEFSFCLSQLMFVEEKPGAILNVTTYGNK